MDDFSNRRQYPRVNVSDDHGARFNVGNVSLRDLILTNLSAGGCCIRVPATQSELLEKGVMVNMVYLIHPSLPSVPLQATVSWLLGKQAGKTEGSIFVGLEFVNANPKFQETINDYVKELLDQA